MDGALYHVVDIDDSLGRNELHPFVRPIDQGEGGGPITFSEDRFAEAFAALGDDILLALDGTDFGHNEGKEPFVSRDGELESLDVWPGSPGSRPEELTPLGDAVYFRALLHVDSSRRLWKTDGTLAGTEFFAEIQSPADLTRVGDFLYFSGSGPNVGRELWRTQGTTAELVRDLRPGNAGSSPAGMTGVGDDVYFLANEGDGIHLWHTTASLEVTKLTRGFELIFDTDSFTSGDGMLYFVARDATRGRELWRSDGTPEGTGIILDLFPGLGGSIPLDASITALGLHAYFAANDGARGLELWKTDGSAEGTVLVADLAEGRAGSSPVNLVGIEEIGRVLFAANHAETGVELWATDGTTRGTVPVADLRPEGHSNPREIHYFQGEVFLSAVDSERGRELWRIPVN